MNSLLFLWMLPSNAMAILNVIPITIQSIISFTVKTLNQSNVWISKIPLHSRMCWVHHEHMNHWASISLYIWFSWQKPMRYLTFKRCTSTILLTIPRVYSKFSWISARTFDLQNHHLKMRIILRRVLQRNRLAIQPPSSPHHSAPKFDPSDWLRRSKEFDPHIAVQILLKQIFGAPEIW